MRHGRAYAAVTALALWACAGAYATPQSSPASVPAGGPTTAPATAPAAGGNELLLYEEIAPVVVAAAKHEQKQSQAPASVSMVTAEEIELYGYHSLADILRTQRGFYVLSDGLNSFVGVRGFLREDEWNARILVMVDGRPTREPIFGQTHLDRDLVVPVEVIKRVEIIRGPGSALYGANAVFAVINIVTRDGADVKNWAELKAQGGNKETGELTGVAGKKFDNGLDVLACADRFTSQGDKDIKYPGINDAADNYGHIRDNDSENAGAGFFKMSYQEFNIEADYGRRDQENSTARYYALFDDPGRMKETRDDLSLRWDHPICDGQSLHAMGFFSEYDYYQFYGAQGYPETYRYWTTAHSNWFGEDVHYDWQVVRQDRLILGSEAMQMVHGVQHDYDTDGDPLVDIDPSLNWWAMYAQNEYTPVSWLTLVAGLRMDKVQRFDPLLDPRAGAIITPNDTDTFKLLYGRAFRAPTLYELYYYDPGANVANPNLKPEITDTYELTWDHDWRNGWHTESGYYMWRTKDSLSVTGPTDAEQTNNIGVTWAQGVECEIEKKWANGARIRLSGNFGHAEHADGTPLDMSPDAVIGLAGTVPVPMLKRTYISVEPQMLSPMHNDTGGWSNASFMTNIVLTSKKVWRGLDLQVGVYNLFGEYARLPHTSMYDDSEPWLRAPGPLVLFTVSYKF